MIHSLGFTHMDDIHFDEFGANEITDCWMDGFYDGDHGEGGLFILHDNHDRDLTKVEIWCQAMWYLSEVANGT